MAEPHIQYVKTSDGVSIAYWTMGDGEPPLVMSPPPLEDFGVAPRYARRCDY